MKIISELCMRSSAYSIFGDSPQLWRMRCLFLDIQYGIFRFNICHIERYITNSLMLIFLEMPSILLIEL